MTYFKFIKESVSNIRTVGTVTRSSKFVSEKMIEESHLKDDAVVVELGAGDGAITKHILKNLGPDGRVIAFELNELFAERLREIQDPRLVVVEDDIAKIKSILAAQGISEVDHIISAIPFVAFPEETSIAMIRECQKVLSENGRFIQLHYSLLLKKLYKKLWGEIEVNFVLRNVPPAWIFTCYQ